MATNTYATALGQAANARGMFSVAVGAGVTAEDNQVVLGYSSQGDTTSRYAVVPATNGLVMLGDAGVRRMWKSVQSLTQITTSSFSTRLASLGMGTANQLIVMNVSGSDLFFVMSRDTLLALTDYPIGYTFQITQAGGDLTHGVVVQAGGGTTTDTTVATVYSLVGAVPGIASGTNATSDGTPVSAFRLKGSGAVATLVRTAANAWLAYGDIATP